MVNYKEIIRLSGEGYTQRQTAACLHCSRNKVSEVLEAAKNANIEGLPDETVSNEELAGILFPGKAHVVGEYLEPDYPYIHKELAKPKVTLSLLGEEYRQKAAESGRKAYMPPQFGDKYRKWARITKATMRIQHKPGDAMEDDTKRFAFWGRREAAAVRFRHGRRELCVLVRCRSAVQRVRLRGAVSGYEAGELRIPPVRAQNGRFKCTRWAEYAAGYRVY